MQQDRRQAPRVPVFFLLEKLGKAQGDGFLEGQGVVKNITPDGLFLETNVRLNKYDHLQLSFMLPSTGKFLSLEAQVRWVEPQKAWTTAGLEFMDLSSDQRQIIMEYCLTLGV